MPDGIKKPRLLSTGAVLTVIGILVVGGLYLARVSSKLSSLKQRNFRIAASLAEMTEKKIDNVGKILQSESRNVKNGQLTDANRLPKLPCFHHVHWHSNQHADLKKDQRTIESDAWDLDFRLKKTLSDEDTSVEEAEGKAGTLHVKASLGCFFSYLGDAEEDAFDDVLVVDSNGRVIFQRGDSSIRIRESSVVRASEDGRPASQDRTKQADETGLWPISLSNLQRMQVGGQQYAMFRQPLRPGFTQEGQPDAHLEWEVIGIVRSDRLLAEALRFPPSLLAYLVAAFLLTFCVLPMIEVWASSPRQRIRPRQVWSTSLGVAFGAAILTLLTLDIGLKWWHQRSLKEKLSHSADEIEQALQSQIEEAVEQLEYLTESFADPDIAARLPRDGAKGNLFDEADLWKQDGDSEEPHPHISMVFWTDDDGQQIAKWTVDETSTPMIEVQEREYFQRAKSGNLWSPSEWNGKLWAPDNPYGDRPAPFFAQGIRSWTTGTQEVIISQRMDATANGRLNTSAEHAMIVTKLPSMLRPILPPGYGFAVLDTDIDSDGNGEVIFHSQSERNGAESFLEECDGAPELEGAIFSNVEHYFTARYWGQEHVMFARPLVGLPWHIVVFQEKDLLQTARFEAIEVALVLLFAEAFLFVLALIVVRFVRGRGAFRLLWPAPDDVKSYARIVAVSVLMVAGLLVSIIWLDSPLLLVLAGLLFPLVTLTWHWSATVGNQNSSIGKEAAGDGLRLRWLVWGAGLAVALVFLLCEGWTAVNGNGSAWLTLLVHGALFAAAGAISWKLGPARPNPILVFPKSFPHLSPTTHFTLTGLVLLAAISILPAAAFLWAATLDRLQLEARRGQLHLAQSLTQRYWNIQSEYENLDNRLMKEVIDDKRDIHYGGYFESDAASFEASAVGNDSAPPPPSLFNFWPLRKLYYLNRHSIEARAVGEKLPESDFWSWTVESGKLVLRGSPPIEFPEMEIGSLRFAPVGSSLAAASLFAIIFAGAVGACVSFVGQRIFHVDLKPVEVFSSSNLDDASYSRLLLIVPPGTDAGEPSAGRGVKTDFGSAKVSNADKELDKLRNRLPRKQSIQIDHLESLLADASTRAKALPLIEAALNELESGVRIVLISRRDPMSVLEAEESCPLAVSADFLKQGSGSQPRPEAILQRWREMLERFTKRWTVLDAAGMENRLAKADDGYFRDIWQTLNTDQRHLLAQIATGSLVNKGLRQPLRRLIGWNLIKPDHLTFHLNPATGERFSEFIREHSDPHDLRRWEQEAAIGVWRHVRIPFYGALALIVLFLLVTQRELFDVTFGLISAGAGSLAAIIKIFDSLRKSPPAR